MISINDSPVTHLQTASEWDELMEKYIIPSHPKQIVEIGSFFGATLWSFIVNSPELEKIVSVDLSIPQDDGRYAEMVRSKEQWKEWSDKVVAIEGDSQSLSTVGQVMREVGDVDILFIDGDHS